jgi:hypothetical protein
VSSSISSTAVISVPPQVGVGDLVDGEVEQPQRGAEQQDAEAGRQDPNPHPLQHGLAVLGPVEHRPPGDGAGIAEPDELQARFGEHGKQRSAEEIRHHNPEHVRHDVREDDVPAAFTRDSGGLHEGAVPQGDRLRSQHPSAPGPAGDGDHTDEHEHAPAPQVSREDDQQRKRGKNEEDVGDR